MHPFRRLVLLGALITAAAAAGPATADSMTREARLGDESEADIESDEVHTWRLDLVAGTTFRVRVRLHDEGSEPTLVVRAPDGSVLDTKTGEDVRISATAAAAGTYRAEVTSPSGDTEYKIDFEGEAPTTGGGGGTTPGGTVHLDAPRSGTVRIEVRRLTGALPEVTAVRDGSGRSLGFRVARTEKDKVRLAPLPVSAPGGLDVDVRGSDGASGTYDVRFRLLDHDDDDSQNGGSHDSDREERKIVLTLQAGTTPEQVMASLPGWELEHVGDGFIVVEAPEGREGFEFEDAAGVDDLLAEVIGAEPDTYLSTPEGTQSQHVILGSELGRSSVPLQPGMDQIRAAAAQLRATGAGVVVAVLDTGADLAHESLAGHLVPGKDFIGNGVTTGDDDPSEETNGLDDDGDLAIDEGFGHGTFVAGLVLAVAPDAKVMPVRVLDTDARGTVSSIAAGIEWAVQNGAHVINLSLGMDARSGVLADAVRYALGNGVVVVAATGNGGLPTAVSFPASVAGVVAVTATDPVTQAPADFANGGAGATVAAPGAAVIGPYPGNQYGTWSGTSFAAAFASGGAALLAEARPTLTPAQVAARFSATALPASRTLTRAQRRRLGGGRLNLSRLLR